MSNHSSKIKYAKGSRIVCTGCEAHIATIAFDILDGEKVDATILEPAGGQAPWANGEQAACRVCKTLWLDNSYLFSQVVTEWKLKAYAVRACPHSYIDSTLCPLCT